MDTTEYISVSDFCAHHSVSLTFITGLQQAGLVQVLSVEQEQYILPDEVQTLEKLVGFHTELDINLEGIEAIVHLLEQVDELQQELRHLKNRLDLYEGL